jgi:hypothetical protein
MKKRFFFRRPDRYSFDMWVAVNDERHEANFLASMVRKGYEIVDPETYSAEVSMFTPYKKKRLAYGPRP